MCKCIWQIFTLASCKCVKIIYTLQQDKCKCKKIGHVKCKWIILRLDLQVIYAAIDTYTHNTGSTTMMRNDGTVSSNMVKLFDCQMELGQNSNQ
jgi:hypothetical protein